MSYYTPTLSDFKIGMEIEVNDLKLNAPWTFVDGKFQDNWVKVVYDGKPFGWLQGYHEDVRIEEINLNRMRIWKK
jgi:hypothetical protein